MNADAFRYLYSYHFAENRKIWNSHVTSLSQEQFTQPSTYSIGSVRNHIIHLMNVDTSWFSELSGVDVPDWLNPTDFEDRDAIRADWDAVEQMMRIYLANLRDTMLFEKPVAEGEDKDLLTWQILLHVVNHGTDHRAQMLRLLNDMGVKTGPQDFIFYTYDHPH